MFRMSPSTAHTWQDITQNIGKLSLAGLFLGGTLLLAHAYAEPAPKAASVSINQHNLGTVATTIATQSRH
jgi:hypothetical protein